MKKFIAGAAIGFLAGNVYMAYRIVDSVDQCVPGTKNVVTNAVKKTFNEYYNDISEKVNAIFRHA